MRRGRRGVRRRYGGDEKMDAATGRVTELKEYRLNLALEHIMNNNVSGY